jgi:hypothetical protein
MKIYSGSLKTKIAAAVLAVSFGLSAYAEPPRDEIAHAYRLLKLTDRDYAGHRAAAVDEVKAAGDDLGLDLHGKLSDHDRQWKSDERLTEARRLLRDARDKLEDHDRDRVAKHMDKAIKEIDSALAVH